MTTDNDFVAEKLAIQDWKSNQECGFVTDFPPRKRRGCGCGSDAPYGSTHDIPAPDLLANPWLLIDALWQRGIRIVLDPDPEETEVDLCEAAHPFYHLANAKVIDGNLPAALLQAAAEMLSKESKP